MLDSQKKHDWQRLQQMNLKEILFDFVNNCWLSDTKLNYLELNLLFWRYGWETFISPSFHHPSTMHFVSNKRIPLHCSDHCSHFSDKGRGFWSPERAVQLCSTWARTWAHERGGWQKWAIETKNNSHRAIIQSPTRRLIYSSLRERNEREWKAGRGGERGEKRGGSRKKKKKKLVVLGGLFGLYQPALVENSKSTAVMLLSIWV